MRTRLGVQRLRSLPLYSGIAIDVYRSVGIVYHCAGLCSNGLVTIMTMADIYGRADVQDSSGFQSEAALRGQIAA